MVIFVLIAVLLLVAHSSSGSYVNDTAQIPDFSLLAMFRACKTRTLRMRAEATHMIWFYNRLLPTRKSVNMVNDLLTRQPASISHHCPGKVAPISSQNAFTAAMKRHAENTRNHASIFLLEYMVFKTLLCGNLSLNEAEVLEHLFSEVSGDMVKSMDFGRLAARLASAKCSGDLFVALAAHIDTLGMSYAMLALQARRPDILSDLVKGYMESGAKDLGGIPCKFFQYMNDLDQYQLAGKYSIPRRYPDSMDVSSLYILSKFSRFPSKNVKRQCLRRRPDYLIYEETCKIAGSLLLASTSDPSFYKLPRELWVKILLGCNNSLFQIYTVPGVCRFWRQLHHMVLSQSSVVQADLVRSLKDKQLAQKIIDCKCYPWNYFLSTPCTLLKYVLLCQQEAPTRDDLQSVEDCIAAIWKLETLRIRNSGLPESTGPYVDMYVRCCRAIGDSLQFYQLSGMSDAEYVTLIKNLVEKDRIVPMLPAILLGRDCERFAKMLENDTALAALLFRDNPAYYDRLAVNLLLTNSHIPAPIDVLLCDKSAFYRLLTNEDACVGKYLDIIAQAYSVDVDRDILARYVIELCLETESESEPRLRLLGKRVLERYSQRHFQEGAKSADLLEHKTKEMLSLDVTMFLCKHCKDYSEEEYSDVLRVLEKCGILDDEVHSRVLDKCVLNFFDNPKSSVEFIQ